MQAFAVILVAGLVAIAYGQEPVKTCFKTTDECVPTLETARGVFRNLRALDTTGAAPREQIAKLISELHDFFQVNLETTCKIELCHCEAGALACKDRREAIRNLIQQVELPECILKSGAAKSLLERFRKAVAEGNRLQTLSVLNLLEKVTAGAIAKGDNDDMINCITDTVQRIRAPIKKTLEGVDIQENCDFCKA